MGSHAHHNTQSVLDEPWLVSCVQLNTFMAIMSGNYTHPTRQLPPRAVAGAGSWPHSCSPLIESDRVLLVALRPVAQSMRCCALITSKIGQHYPRSGCIAAEKSSDSQSDIHRLAGTALTLHRIGLLCCLPFFDALNDIRFFDAFVSISGSCC